MIQNCPVCGKRFDIPWPHQWAYKRNSQYICSWKCLRAGEQKRGESDEMSGTTKVPDEVKRQAIEAAISGGSPHDILRPYSKNPKSLWTYMKMQMQKKDPETYNKIQAARQKKPEPTLADAMAGMKDAADQFFGMCDDMGLKLDKQEEPKITKPVNYDGFNVRAVEGEYGSYHFQEINGKQWLDFDDKECANEMSMTVEQWRGFLAEIRKAALILGVEL